MITYERASQLLEPNFETGELVWKWNDQRPDLIGVRAGHVNNGYWRLSIDGEEHYCCQIIWLLATKEWPAFTVDHKDGIESNDALYNLRLATKGQNAANSKMNSRNTSGLKGASFCTSTWRWRSSICIAGVRKNLGRFDTKEEAHEAWKRAAIEAYGEEYVRAA